MKILRTVILPLLLCGVILFAGYCTPMLFNYFTPDLTNEVRSFPVSDMDNPMYLENTAEIVLPPWDQIIEYQAKPLTEVFPMTLDEQTSCSEYIRITIATLFPEAEAKAEPEFIDDLQIYNEAHIFLRDYSYTPYEGADACKLDLVLYSVDLLPLYCHLSAQKTAPAADEAALRDDMEQLLNELKFGVFEEARDPAEILCRIADSSDDSFMPLLARTLLRLICESGCEELWLSILLGANDVYTLTYQDETLLVLTDDQNRTCCLFYDGLSNRITGYSIDPKLTGIFEETEATEIILR